MSLFHSLAARSPAANPSAARLLLRIVQWVGGLSLSTVILLLILFLTTIVLRRKGYGVRLGFCCIIVYARPGSRRFPDGCEVRVTTRIVGFLFGGCRGPWLDISAERFYMRLRPTLVRPRLPRRWMSLLRFFWVGVAAVDRGYWSTFFRNLMTRILAFWIRGLRVRVDKVRVWKDGGTWEYRAEQFVLAGHAVGVFGSKYSLSVNELFVNVCKSPLSDSDFYKPIHANLVLRKGVEIIAYLTPRLLTIFRPRRLAIMDDLRLSVTVRDVSCTAPRILDASITHIVVELCPGYSRTLRAKLPPSAPATKRPRKPGILRYWEGNGALHGLSLRFATPIPPETKTADIPAVNPLPPSYDPLKKHSADSTRRSENGGFVRLDSIRVEAYGKAADERHDAMTRASVSIRGCSAGSTTVDALSHSLYESSTTEGLEHEHQGSRVESVENIEKIVTARPEALIWIEDITTAIDMNCSRRHAMRVDVAGNGGVVALEPVGLGMLVNGFRSFISKYHEKHLRREQSASSFESESMSSLPRTSSTNSLHSTEGEPTSLRIVSDMRHWTFIVLGHGPVGDGDTLAIVASSDSIVLNQVAFFGSSYMRVAGQVKNFVLMHWSEWTHTTNIVCREGRFDINEGLQNGKSISLKNAAIDWDLDVQSGLASLPVILKSLRDLKTSGAAESPDASERGTALSDTVNRLDHDRINVSEDGERNPEQDKHAKLLRTLGDWQLTGTDVSVSYAFPDGPNMGISVGNLPTTTLNAKTFVGHHVVWRMQDKKLAYAKELRLDSLIHTMHRSVEKQSVTMDLRGLRFILYYDFPFGYLLQDWLLRLRASLKIARDAKLRRQGIDPDKRKKRPLPDIRINISDLELHFEDHPLGGFYTSMLPLMQDEARERMAREDLMMNHIQQLSTIARAGIAGTASRCINVLRAKDSDIWIDRVKQLKQACPGRNVAEGYLPSLPFPPSSSFVAASLSLSIIMDDIVRVKGSEESIRRLRMLDDYELGAKKFNKVRHLERDAWNSIGFRAASFEARGVRLRFRDYGVAFLVIDRIYFDNATVGQAVQATLPPYVAETTVAIGRRRLVKVVKGLGPTKSFVDIHLVADTLQCGFNPSFLSAVSEFGKGVSKFFGGGKNPSPRIPWFDNLRVNMHGRMRITAKKFKGHLTSSISPYSMTKHVVDIESDNFEMLCSRLEATEEDPYPISFKLYNWHIRPYNFDKKRRSEITFEFVRVGFNPKINVLSGDPQDHYFVPFPSKEEVVHGGPGIGKGTYTLKLCERPVSAEDNGFGNYTTWLTGLHEIPGYDSFKEFKTHSMILGLNILAQHAQADRMLRRNTAEGLGKSYDCDSLSPRGASIVHSDAVSTLIKVIKILVHRPISCRLGPRRMGPVRKPPSKTGMSTALRGLDVVVDAKDLNVMLYNNLEPGHGLFISIGYLNGELWKRTEISQSRTGSVVRTSKLTRRRFNIVDVFSSIRVPGLDLAVDSDDMGKLLTVDKISLSDDPRDEVHYMASPSSKGVNRGPSSGFGSGDMSESPFYTFSDIHPFQRGKKLDKVQYDKRLLVDRVRLIWSPVRRSSVFAWPDAFKEKTFTMRPAKVKPSSEAATRGGSVSTTTVMSSTPDIISQYDPPAPYGDRPARGSVAELLGDNGEQIPVLNLSKPAQKLEPRAPIGHVSRMPLPKRAASSPVRPVANEKIKLHVSALRHRASGSGGKNDPMSPPMLAMSRPAAIAMKRQGGDMRDLLSQFASSSNPSLSQDRKDDDKTQSRGEVRSAMEVLKTWPKLALYINDCQVAFGSPETSGIVFLASNAVRVGIVDKTMQKTKQLGKTNERWCDREFRFHLNEANLFTRSTRHGSFDFSARNWVPQDGNHNNHLSLVTTSPICMDLMYISSSSLPQEDGTEEEDDYILRPSLLFINIPDISMSTNTDEFHAATDVVRKVLMQSMRYSELVNEELARIRYNLQLLGGKVSSEALDELMRRLNNVTRQFLYAGDTFQQELVKSLMLPDESTFSDNLLRYKAKAKAVATYTRQDQLSSSKDVLYPTMYVSYSFDKLSWELRETRKEGNKVIEDPFVEITLEDLVCRHVFYVGRGSSTEITFGNISAKNKMRSAYFPGILQPATTGTKYGPEGSKRKTSRIKASDGTAVAFRWYSTQEDKVGGIPVYETLTIQVAPMTAAVTRKLYSSVSDFIFSARSIGEEGDAGPAGSGKPGTSSTRVAASRPSFHNGSASSAFDSKAGSHDSMAVPRRTVRTHEAGGGRHGTSKHDVSVSEMAQRGESSILFKYVFIDALELTASYKNKETPARGVLDIFELFVTTPSYSYSSQVWTWKKFAGQIRKDLLMTFALRGVSDLAKMKLLPGYNRARRKLARGADSMKESIYSVLPSSPSVDREESEEAESAANEDVVHNGMESGSSGSIPGGEEEDREAAIDAAVAAVADVSGAERMRHEKILRALYGSYGRLHASRSGTASGFQSGRGSGSLVGSESSFDSGAHHRGVGRIKPPLAPGERKTTSVPSGGSVEEEVPMGLLRRLKRRVQERHSGSG